MHILKYGKNKEYKNDKKDILVCLFSELHVDSALATMSTQILLLHSWNRWCWSNHIGYKLLAVGRGSSCLQQRLLSKELVLVVYFI